MLKKRVFYENPNTYIIHICITNSIPICVLDRCGYSQVDFTTTAKRKLTIPVIVLFTHHQTDFLPNVRL